MTELLKKLCEADGVSGNEKAVRDVIIEEIDGHCEWHIDPLGNIIAEKKGKKRPSKKIMLDAHTDEVGVIATYINDDGFISFSAVSPDSIRVESLLSKRVRFGNGTIGIIGQKPIHLLSKEESKKLPSRDSLYIDIGCDSKEEAEKLVLPGDVAAFDAPFTDNGGFITAKAIDDRAGCAIIIKLLQGEPAYDITATFTVQEELGLRGAATAAFSVNPDFCICLEATTASDIAGVEGGKRVCLLGEGPTISFMDNSTLYDRDLFKAALDSGVKCQVKTAVAGGNNSGSIHKSRGGVRTITISVPCRYIHSSSCCSKIEDINGAYSLAARMIEIIGGQFCD